jgi:ABC-2 type transport system ATP-binding protein
MIREMVEGEGRTVFLSSHLLDEVERVCDFAAIVDCGRVVAQGSLAELAGRDTRHELRIAVDDPALAFLTLDRTELVREIHHESGDELSLILAGGPESAMEVNARLVDAGVGVLRLEPVRQTLEQRFLQVTSRLESPSQEIAA